MFEITAVFMRYEKRALMMKSCWNKIMKGNKKKNKKQKTTTWKCYNHGPLHAQQYQQVQAFKIQKCYS